MKKKKSKKEEKKKATIIWQKVHEKKIYVAYFEDKEEPIAMIYCTRTLFYNWEILDYMKAKYENLEIFEKYSRFEVDGGSPSVIGCLKECNRAIKYSWDYIDFSFVGPKIPAKENCLMIKKEAK